jgi:hypothetical protein
MSTGFGTDPVPSVNVTIQGTTQQVSDASNANTTPVDTFQGNCGSNSPDAG